MGGFLLKRHASIRSHLRPSLRLGPGGERSFSAMPPRDQFLHPAHIIFAHSKAAAVRNEAASRKNSASESCVIDPNLAVCSQRAIRFSPMRLKFMPDCQRDGASAAPGLA